MKRLSILLSLLALNGCSYFDNVWSCIEYADTHNNDVIDTLRFNEYDFTNGIVSTFSTSNPEMFSTTMNVGDLNSRLYQAFLMMDSDIFEDKFSYNFLNQIKEDALYIKFNNEDVFGGISKETIIKKQPNSDEGKMIAFPGSSIECKKTRVSGWGMELHFPDQWNFEL